MNQFLIFSSPEFGAVRTVTINNEPWFVGKDVAAALGYANPREAIRDHVDPEDKLVGEQNSTPSIIDSLGREQLPVFINEPGLYSLVFSSKLASAKRFKRWVFSEVLPSLRSTGTYTMSQLRVMEDKVSLFDRLSGGYDDKNFRDSARALNISQSQLIGWLTDSRIISRTQHNEIIPSPEFKQSGFFVTKRYRNQYSGYDGIRTLITPTGLMAFAHMLDAAGLNRKNMKKHGGRAGGNKDFCSVSQHKAVAT